MYYNRRDTYWRNDSSSSELYTEGNSPSVSIARNDTDGNRRVLVLQHAASETPGTIEDALKSAGLAFDYVRAFEGQQVPLSAAAWSALIVMGGPMGVYETRRYPFLLQETKLIESFLRAQLPVLGVCLGSQLIAASLGANVRKGSRKEIGWHPIELSEKAGNDPLWSGQPSRFVGYHWHGDIFDLPAGAVSLASSHITPVQAYRYGDRAYGLLFHMEVTENQIRGMLNEFAAEIQQEGLSAVEILKQSESFLPPLQKIGATVFSRWAELI
jgi:GMP synthase (glutamine-hydrolysing)